MKKALILGASSGIGRALALTLAKNGYIVGLMARRLELLETLQKEINPRLPLNFNKMVGIAKTDPVLLSDKEFYIDKEGVVALLAHQQSAK